MITFFMLITLMGLAIPFYVYVGYPALLLLLNCVFKQRSAVFTDQRPSVTMIISCYNEVAVIEDKIKNCLSLSYPADLIEFIFLSDGSDDGTDEIIKRYESEVLRLIRQEGRLGKTSGLNLAVPESSGDIVVFSDANAMYQQDAIEMLVRNFCEENVGYVVGAALYTDAGESSAAKNESSYWDYEIFLKKMESSLNSVVGGDGAIYAIRKYLYQTLDRKDINDFVNPLQIVAKGYRGVFEPEAKCFEETAGSFEQEGARKERIVNRSFRGLMQVRSVMNPFKVGLFSLFVVSHKLLRWLVPFFLIVATIGIVALSFYRVSGSSWLLFAMLLFFTLALVGFLLSKSERPSMVFAIPYYFILVNLYSLKGVVRYFQGETQVVWTSSRSSDSSGTLGRVQIAVSSLIILLFFYGWLVRDFFL